MNIIEIEELAMKIEDANEAYRKGKPMMPDAVFDHMVRQLKREAPDHALFTTGVINPHFGIRKEELPHPMYSLDKFKTLEELYKWFKKLGLFDSDEIVAMPKYNGISLLSDFKTKTAWTRGDGVIGNRCDPNLLNFINIGGSFGIADMCYGEAIISHKNWQAHFKGKLAPSGKPYKLNHSTVSGLINADDSDPAILHIDFIKYGVATNSDYYYADKEVQLNYLNKHSTNVACSFTKITVKQIQEDPESLNDLYQIWSLAYPIDGLVLELNSYKLREKLGRETNLNPAFAKALKLDEWVDDFETIITGYKLTVSKQGFIKGTAQIEPIEIDGSEVTQASFYNMRYVRDFCLYPGAEITIRKSGDIIPKITSVECVNLSFKSEPERAEISKSIREKIKFKLDFTTPLFEVCPACGTLLEWGESNVDLFCPNEDCEGRIVSKLEHFFSTVGVEEFGRPTIELLVQNGFTFPKIILNIGKEDLMELEGFAETSANNLVTQFEKAKKTPIPLARLLHALDLFEGKIGEKTVQMIFDNAPSLLEDLPALVKIKGVSDLTAKAYLLGLEAFRDIPDSMLPPIPIAYITTPKTKILSEKYKGWHVCFSGVRDQELEENIVANAGEIASGVSKGTTHLIVADVDQSTSKTVKARELNIPILTIEQFKLL